MLIFNFGEFLLDKAYHAFNCMLTEKKNKTLSLLFFCFSVIQISFLVCGDIEKNAKPRFSSFLSLNLSGLTAHDSIKSRYFKRISYSLIML